MSYVFFGANRFSRCVLSTLCAYGYPPTNVVTRPDSLLAYWARTQNIEIVSFDGSFLKLRKILESNPVDYFIVAGFNILPKEIFILPKYGSINVHPSLLPQYRGSHPEIAQVLEEEQNTGVTLHFIDEKIDAGALLLQTPTHLPTHLLHAEDIGLFSAMHAGHMLAPFIQRLSSDTLKTTKQDELNVTLTKQILGFSASKVHVENDHAMQWLHYRAFKHTYGMYFLLQSAHTTHQVHIHQAYFRNNIFVIKTVSVDSTLSSISYEKFLSTYALATEPVWTRFSATYNKEVTSHTDLKNEDPSIRVRETLFELLSCTSTSNLPTTKDICQEDLTINFASAFWSRWKYLYPFSIVALPSTPTNYISTIQTQGDALGMPVTVYSYAEKFENISCPLVAVGLSLDHMEAELLVLRDLVSGKVVSCSLIKNYDIDHYRTLLDARIELFSFFSLRDFGISTK